MYVVHVQNKDGSPLDPTKRFGWVTRSLKQGRAVVVSRKPFIIRLTYQIETPVTKSYVGATDPGRTNIGNAVVCTNDSHVVYTDKVEARNKEIPKLMDLRKQHRQASRRGERLARKRLAKKHKTLSAKLESGRLIPGCKKATNVKDIINTESRFMNRKRHNNVKDVLSTPNVGWLTPTAKQLVQTHLRHVDQIRRLYPITDWCFELNKFAFMRMEDGSVQGIDFQNGRLKGYNNPKEFVFAMQDGKCAHCGKPIYDTHHIIPRSQDGGDGPDNLVGLCDECHHLVHIGELDFNLVGEKQKYAALSVLNQAIPYIYLGLVERFGEEHVHCCNGYETKLARDLLGLPKDHDNDAVCIAYAGMGVEATFGFEESFDVKQFRHNDRAIIKCQKERTYKMYLGKDKNGRPKYKTIAKNRRSREQQRGSALSQWYDKQIAKFGVKQANKMRSQLKCIKSTRSYNLPPEDRLMPGATYKHNGKRYVLQAREGNGRYFIATDKTKVRSAECIVLTKNTGLVYL